ncbi:MAG TPA: phage minor head protein [Devosia sp.]|nr:phage minor head protein [Devosia sp.]
MPTSEETRRRREAEDRARLQAALERVIAQQLAEELDRIAEEAARLAREKRNRDEIIALILPMFYTTTLVALLTGRLYAVAYAFADRTATSLGVTSSTVTDAAVRATQEWVPAFVSDQMRKVSKTTAKVITRIVDAAVAEGADDIEIGKRLADALGGDRAVVRSRIIAATLSHATAGQASDNAARFTNLPIARIWVSMEDTKVRPTHAIADGQIVDLEHPFLVGGYYLRFPGDPLGPAREIMGCRCVALHTRAALTRTEPVPNRLIGRGPQDR